MHKGFLYYPVVGLILGLCDMAVFLLVSLILPEVFGILFAMLANLCLTGAFHLDGLSDICRWNLFGKNERENA